MLRFIRNRYFSDTCVDIHSTENALIQAHADLSKSIALMLIQSIFTLTVLGTLRGSCYRILTSGYFRHPLLKETRLNQHT